MTRNRSKQLLTALTALLAIGFASRASAQDSTDARIQELVRLATARIAAGSQAGSTSPAAQAAAPAGPSGPTLSLTMDDLVKLTLDRNLGIAVQRLNPQINDVAIANLLTAYHPIVGSTLNQQSRTSLPNSILSLSTSAAAPVSSTMNYNGSITQNVEWGGGNFSASLNNFRETTTANTTLFNPQFQSAWTFNYTQPLMRNRRIDLNRENIYIAKVSRDMSDVTLRSTITNTIANAQKAYWEYVYALESVQVAQDSLNIAHQLVQDNNTRVEVGTMAPLDVLTARSQEATAQQQLVAAQATQRTDQIALKQFIVTGADDPNWNITIDAVDKPDFTPQPIDVAAALRRAMSERTDLELVKQTVQENNVILKYLGDQLKPQADLGVSYGTQGVGGPAIQRSSTGLGGVETGVLPGGIGDAYSSLFSTAYPVWSVGVTFSYPLFQSSQEATIARARIQQNQVSAQIKQTELQVATDVTNDAIAVQNAVEAAQAAAVAVNLAQSELDAEQSKFDVGMSTNYNVVLAQQTLSNAKQSQLRAIANYREALVELDRVQQTTLASTNITILGR